MQYLGYTRKKVTTPFIVDNIDNPTIIYGRGSTGTLKKEPVFRIKIKKESIKFYKTASGACLRVEDYETNHFYEFCNYEIADFIKTIGLRNCLVEDNYFVCFVKPYSAGVKLAFQVVNPEEELNPESI